MTFTNSKKTPVRFNPAAHVFRFHGKDLEYYCESTKEGLAVARLKSQPNLLAWVSIESSELEDTLSDMNLPGSSDVPDPMGPPRSWKLDERGVPTLTKVESYRVQRRRLRRVAKKVNPMTKKHRRDKVRSRPGRNDFRPQITD